MPSDNIIIASGPSGATYNMATDYGFGTSADAHVQIVKAVYGDDTTSTRVSNTNPMPVQLFSGYSGGSTASIIEDGQLKVKGTLNIGNQIAIHGSTAGFLKVIVAGGVTGTSGGTGLIGATTNPAVYSAVEVTGSVQGISGGFLVGVSANDFDIRTLSAGVIGYTGVTLSDSVAVQGISGGTAVNVSATDLDIRGLTAATDSVSIVGTAASNVGVTGTVTAIATDSVTGVTFSVNVAANIGVSNTSGTTLAVEGTTGMMPIKVEGSAVGNAVLVSASDLDIRSLSATDQVTVVGDVATNTATVSTRVSAVDTKLGTLNTTLANTNTKVDTANASLTSLSTSVTTVGTEKFVKTSVNQVVPPSTLFVQTMTISGTGRPLKNQVLQNGLTIKSSNNNTGTIYIGGTSIQNNIEQGYPLEAGEEIFLSVGNANAIYLRTMTGRTATVNVIGS